MKSGLDYFPLDVSLDEKWELIEAEFGLTGFSVIVKLLQRIYGQQGYYCEWTNEVALLFGKQCGLGGNAVSEIVSAAIKRGIFDKMLYEKYQILTSKGIQKRYFEAVRRRKSVKVKKQYLLIKDTQNYNNVHISSENVNISSKNDDISKQSKVEKSKVEKSRDSAQNPRIDYQGVVDLFHSICVSLPKLRLLNDGRKKAIKAASERLKAVGGFEALFNAVEESDFLTGRNGKWSGCGFDWILKPANMVKIIEGNFANKGAKPKKETSYDLDEYDEMVNNFIPVYRGK